MNTRLTLSFLLIIYINSNTFAQPCSNPDYTFTEQSQIDNFLVMNPNCSEITGNLVIGVEVQHLDGLKNITKIGGYLSMSNCDNLQNIEGLSNLEEIGSYARIQHNPQLKSLAGLDKLSKVSGEFFYISDNKFIKNLSPLLNLDTVNGIFQVYLLDSIVDLSGLNNLKYIKDDFSIFKNKSLIKLNGLTNIKTIGGAFRIYENESLTNLLDLPSYLTLGGQLVIYDNPKLSSCQADFVCNFISNNPNNALITNNLNGCDNAEQITQLCISSIDENSKSKYSIYPNPTNDILTIVGLAKAAKVNIYSANGELIQSTFTDKNIDLTLLPSGNYTITFLNNKLPIIKL